MTALKSVFEAGSDDELFDLLANELARQVSVGRDSPQFLPAIQKLPVGLRAMAATFELDVSLTLDDLGWHFGNWHDAALAEETARGLEELGATELAGIFREAYRLAVTNWDELGAPGWGNWYHGSELELAMEPLNERAWAILEGKKKGIFDYWVAYARKYPERVGAG